MIKVFQAPVCTTGPQEEVAMECPYCHAPLAPETPCMSHPPVPMSFWPGRSTDSGADAPAQTAPAPAPAGPAQ